MVNLCSGAFVAGCVGFVLRKMQWMAYDSQTELFTGNPMFLLPLFVLLAVLALAAVRGGKKLAAQSVTRSFYCPQTLYMMLMVASAFLFLGAGMLGMLTGVQKLTLWRYDPTTVLLTEPVSVLLCALLCFPAGVAVLLMGKEGYRGAQEPKSPVLSVLPPFAGTIWLFATHMEHATDPVLLRYGILMAAVVALTFASYDVAGAFQGKQHPVRFPVFCVMGVVLGITALADRGLSWFHMCLLIAFSVMVLAQFYAYLVPEQCVPTDFNTEDE